jgi:GYF domain 2
MEGFVSAPSDIVWYVSREGKQFGPLSADEFAKLEDQNGLLPSDQVWRTGMDVWIAYSDFDARKAAARFAGKHRPTSSTRADDEKCAICLLMRKGMRALAKASITAFRNVATHLAKIRTMSSSRAADAFPLHPPEGAATRAVPRSADRHPAPILPSLGVQEPNLQRLTAVLQPTAGGTVIAHSSKDDREGSMPNVRTESATEPVRRSPLLPRLVSEGQAAAAIGLELATFRDWVADGQLPHPLPDCGKYDLKAIHLALDRMSGIGGDGNQSNDRSERPAKGKTGATEHASIQARLSSSPTEVLPPEFPARPPWSRVTKSTS